MMMMMMMMAGKSLLVERKTISLKSFVAAHMLVDDVVNDDDFEKIVRRPL